VRTTGKQPSGECAKVSAMAEGRIQDRRFASRVMPADAAAALIGDGTRVGVSGFAGAGYPKAVPSALARRIADAHERGEAFALSVFTGASTGPDLDGVLAATDGIDLLMPYQSDPVTRARINAGQMDYLDVHLSHVAQMVWEGFFGHLDVAVVEVAGITPDGHLMPSTSVGNNKTWLDLADRIVLEVNAGQPAGLEGMHDVYYGTALPPHRWPIPIVGPADRIGSPYLHCTPDKVVAVVLTEAPDRPTAYGVADERSSLIAGHVLELLEHEVRRGRLGRQLLPIQSGVGNIANAVLGELDGGPFGPLTAYSEVIQDAMLGLLRSGTMSSASATAFCLSEGAIADLTADITTRADGYREKIVLRPQEISNHPEVVRRLGCIAMNGMIEADIYGNVNSTHVAGSQILNGIGGSGDFARNAYLSIFVATSTTHDGAISRIVPMVSHVDHTEHDVHVVVTEQGIADLRGLSPKKRARQVIEHCAHPDYRDALSDYFERAIAQAPGKHTPHVLAEALSWHVASLRDGTMRDVNAR
jgi:succinyl-CoA:acetate CoA-transferase